MRMPLRRRSLALLAFWLVSTAALSMGRPGDPPAPSTLVLPTFVPPADPPTPQVQRTAHTEPARGEVPSVSLDWTGPATVKVREKGDYTLMVRNVSTQPLQKVVVQVRVPKHATLEKTTPEAKQMDGVFLWELGTLESKAAKPLTLTLTPTARGDLGCQAWVTFTGTAGLTVTVKEPKISAKLLVPAKVALGDPIAYTLRVENVGDCLIDQVRYEIGEKGERDTETGSTAGYKDNANGLVLNYSGAQRATRGGDITFVADVTGSHGTKATAEATVHVMVPKLTTTVTGPAEILVGRKAKYTVTVTNTGELPLSDIAAVVTVPAGFRLTDARTGKPDSGLTTVTCNAVSLDPGAKHEFTYEAVAVKTGAGRHAVAATGSRDTKAVAECPTTVEGIAALRMEVVDLVDPVEKGGETTYEIRLTNTGSKADSDLRLVIPLPKEFEFVSGSGPTKGMLRVGVNFTKAGLSGESTVSFEPIAELAPQTEAVFRVKLKAIAAGDVRFKAVLTSKQLSTPVVKEESTRVYGE